MHPQDVHRPYTPDMAARTLVAATYNVHHGVGLDNQLDLARIATVIAHTGADIIFVQELDRFWPRTRHQDQPRELAQHLRQKGLPVDYRFQANVDKMDGRQYGTAIFSRYRFLSENHVVLPNTAGLEQRGALDVTVEYAPGQLVRLLGTHLQAGAPSKVGTLRQTQTEHIAKLIAQRTLPTIVGGDFNEMRGATQLLPLSKRLREAHDMAVTQRTTAWTRTHSQGIFIDIDHLYVSKEFTVQETWTIPSDASDHFPFVARLQLS